MSAALEGGFADPAPEAARAFRAALRAMARPGSIERVTGARPPAPLSPAAGALLLVLADPETPVFLAGAADAPMARDWVAFHCGAPFASAERAMFAVGRWEDLGPLDRFAVGTADYPDRSATLIVETDRLEAAGARLTGPGIEREAFLPLPEIAAFRRNRARFPLGLDFWFCAGDRIAALPRTTRVEAA